MPRVYVRVQQIVNCPPGDKFANTRQLEFKSNTGSTPKTVLLQGLQTLMTYDVFDSDFIDPHKTTFGLTLIEPLYENNPIATITLPITWFSPNSVVIDSFPMRPRIQGIPPPMIYLMVHVVLNDAQPFQAPPGQLLIIPMWRPQQQPMCYYQPPPPGFVPQPIMSVPNVPGNLFPAQVAGVEPIHRPKRSSDDKKSKKTKKDSKSSAPEPKKEKPQPPIAPSPAVSGPGARGDYLQTSMLDEDYVPQVADSGYIPERYGPITIQSSDDQSPQRPTQPVQIEHTPLIDSIPQYPM